MALGAAVAGSGAQRGAAVTSERWRQIKRVLDLVGDAAPEDRSRVLVECCGADRDLRREAESLLSFEGEAEVFEQAARPASIAGVPERIGPYRVERLLGAGGMGAVYLAVRDDDQYRKQVAIKVIPTAGDPDLLSRFRAERQIVAGLDHPYIARLLDGGALADGRPYFVMEHIAGQRIDAYAAEKRLDTAAILRLFLKVCSAVQFAHQNLVVHRDLKAGNILVSADGEPHLLDFGIAKVLDSGPAADPDAEQTQTLQRRLTPISASPEQMTGGSITTASDVYSLGILLYRLLSGVSPYAGAKDFTTEAARVVREYRPPRPSAAPGMPAKLRRVLAGDLDNMVGKAIEKDPGRRYATVEEFARDLDCYLAGRPVRARPASLLYRARKFVGRNRLPVAGAAILILAIAGGIAGTLWNARRAGRQFESLRKLTNSMLFEFYDSIKALPGSTDARMLVVRRAQEYLEQMAAEARGNPAVLRDLAAAYERIGQILAGGREAHLGGPGSFRQARHLFDKALAIRRGLAAANPADRALQLGILETLQDISKVYQFEGDLPRAIELRRQRLELLERLAARDASEDLNYDLGISFCLVGSLKNDAGDYQSALEYQHRGEAILQTLRDAHPEKTRYRWALGIAHLRRGYILGSQHRWPEAADQHRRAVADLEPRAAASPNDTNVQRAFATANQNLCEMLARANLFSDIRRPCERAVEGFGGLVQADKNNVQAIEDLANADWTMSLALDRMNLPRDAIGFEQRARALYRDVEARDPDSTEAADEDGESLLHLGILEAKLRRPVLARKHLTQALAMYEQLEKRNPRHARILEHLGMVREAIQALPGASANY